MMGPGVDSVDEGQKSIVDLKLPQLMVDKSCRCSLLKEAVCAVQCIWESTVSFLFYGCCWSVVGL